MISFIYRGSEICLVAVLLLFAGSLNAQEGKVVLARGNSTIVLEPYAPNILRVTLSLERQSALAAPGYGVIAAPTASGWSASQTAKADVYSSNRIVATVDRPPDSPGDDGSAYFIGSAPSAHITLRTPEGKTLLEMTGWMQAVPNQKDGTAEVLRDRRPTDAEVLYRGRNLRLARRRALLRPGPEPGRFSRPSRPRRSLLGGLSGHRRAQLLRAVSGDQQRLRTAVGQPLEDLSSSRASTSKPSGPRRWATEFHSS